MCRCHRPVRSTKTQPLRQPSRPPTNFRHRTPFDIAVQRSAPADYAGRWEVRSFVRLRGRPGVMARLMRSSYVYGTVYSYLSATLSLIVYGKVYLSSTATL